MPLGPDNLLAATWTAGTAAEIFGHRVAFSMVEKVCYFKPDRQSNLVQDYSEIRDTINRKLEILGRPRSMQQTISNEADFTNALRVVITAMNQMQPQSVTESCRSFVQESRRPALVFIYDSRIRPKTNGVTFRNTDLSPNVIPQIDSPRARCTDRRASYQSLVGA